MQWGALGGWLTGRPRAFELVLFGAAGLGDRREQLSAEVTGAFSTEMQEQVWGLSISSCGSRSPPHLLLPLTAVLPLQLLGPHRLSGRDCS